MNDSAIGQDGRRPAGALASIALAGGCGLYALNALNPLQEAIKHDIGLDDGQLGILHGLAVGLPLIVAAVPFGIVTDRGDRARFLLVLTFCAFAGLALPPLLPGFAALIVGRVLVGLAWAGGIVVALSLLSDLYEPHLRGRATMKLVLSMVAGSSIAFLAGGFLMKAFGKAWGDAGWRPALLAMALPVLLACLPLLRLHNPSRTVPPPTRSTSSIAVLRPMAPALALLVIGLALVTLADIAVAVWSVPVLVRTMGLDVAQSGAIMGAVMLIAGLGGSAMGGTLTDHVSKHHGLAGVAGLAALLCVASIGLAFYPLAPTILLCAGAMLLFLVLGYAIAVTATALATLLAPDSVRGLCLTILNSVSKVASMVAGPSLVPLLSARLGGEARLAEALGLVAALAMTGGAVAFGCLWLRLRLNR